MEKNALGAVEPVGEDLAHAAQDALAYGDAVMTVAGETMLFGLRALQLYGTLIAEAALASNAPHIPPVAGSMLE